MPTATAALGSLTAMAYVDVNHDGIFDTGDTVLSTVPVTLTGPITRTMTTAPTGGHLPGIDGGDVPGELQRSRLFRQRRPLEHPRRGGSERQRQRPLRGDPARFHRRDPVPERHGPESLPVHRADGDQVRSRTSRSCRARAT